MKLRLTIIIGGGRSTGGGGRSPSPAEYQRARMYLNELALRTGGRLYNGNSMQTSSSSRSKETIRVRVGSNRRRRFKT